MKTLAKDKGQAFKDTDYRHAYFDEFLNASIATQIKVLREQRNWSQQTLAKEADMLQPRISVMENVNYSSWSIKILRKLAEAFDLTLIVSFEEFGARAGHFDEFNRENLERRSFKDDPVFKDTHEDEKTKMPPAPPLPKGQGLWGGGGGITDVTDMIAYKETKNGRIDINKGLADTTGGEDHYETLER